MGEASKRDRLAKEIHRVARDYFGDIMLPWEVRTPDRDRRVRLCYELADKMIAEIPTLKGGE